MIIVQNLQHCQSSQSPALLHMILCWWEPDIADPPTPAALRCAAPCCPPPVSQLCLFPITKYSYNATSFQSSMDYPTSPHFDSRLEGTVSQLSSYSKSRSSSSSTSSSSSHRRVRSPPESGGRHSSSSSNEGYPQHPSYDHHHHKHLRCNCKNSRSESSTVPSDTTRVRYDNMRPESVARPVLRKGDAVDLGELEGK